MALKPATLLSVVLLAGCAAVGEPDSSNLSAYCTAENAFRLGSQSKAYFGVCPRETESAFLAGLQRGRAVRPSTPQAWPFQEKMARLESELRAAGSDAERERIRAGLRDAEWWSIHLINNPGSVMN
jgi:uncharacterized protein DUF2799